MSNNQQYLFLLTIGPVQSFIEQARKSQDLYAGSRILSQLTKAGIKAIGEQYIIFPKPSDLEKAESLPNRFIAKVSADQDLKALGQKVESAVREAWRIIADQALKNAKAGISIEWEHYENNETILQKAFYQQIKQHLDIHWAFEPIEKDDYATAYKNLEALVGSIKNLRPFQQFTYNRIGEKGRKCSLDGERNVLFYRQREDENGKKTAPPHIYLNNAKKMKGNDLNPGEGLSAVSFVKRFYLDETFPSTAEVALMYDEQQIQDEGIQSCLASYKKIFKGEKEFTLECLKIQEKVSFENKSDLVKPFDYQQLYEEGLHEKVIPNKAQLACAKKIFPSLRPYFKTKYYALIIFDGDKMGEWLSGKYLREGIKLEGFHRAISELLAVFAQKATEIVDSPKGKTIYAGGDDFLGMVNIHHLFEVMSELRQEFELIVNQDGRIKSYKKVDASLTFSAGVVIAHYKMPLAEVLKVARKTEKKAKQEGDRNAFAITAMKHSGEVQETVMKWGNNRDMLSNWHATNGIVTNITDKTSISAKFSTKFIQSLTVELMQLGGTDAEFSNKILVEAEISRLVKRAKEKGTTEREMAIMQDYVMVLWETYGQGLKVGNRTQNFIHALQLADFITRKTH